MKTQRQLGQVHPVGKKRLDPFDPIQRVFETLRREVKIPPSPSGQRDSNVNVSVRLPSSNGTAQ